MTHHISKVFENPSFAVLASTASALVAEIVNGPLAFITQLCAAGTGVLVFLFWLRKFVIQGLHDWRAFKRGKLPPVDTTEPNK